MFARTLNDVSCDLPPRVIVSLRSHQRIREKKGPGVTGSDRILESLYRGGLHEFSIFALSANDFGVPCPASVVSTPAVVQQYDHHQEITSLR